MNFPEMTSSAPSILTNNESYYISGSMEHHLTNPCTPTLTLMACHKHDKNHDFVDGCTITSPPDTLTTCLNMVNAPSSPGVSVDLV